MVKNTTDNEEDGMKNLSKWLLYSTLIFAIPGITSADSYRDAGDYRIHYNTFNSKMLTPQIAQNYDIRRSGHNAVLNITVQKKDENGGYQPEPAMINATTKTITGLQKSVAMTEINEGEVVYYIGQFKFVDGEKLKFDVTVIPTGSQTVALQFEQQFFVER